MRRRSLLTRLNNPKDVRAAWGFASFLLVVELLLCTGIIANVPYTEIDWQAYMQEVQGYQDGELDYMKLKGDTGPLVYPAGFVYLFSFLRHVTGGAVAPAQVVFAALYLATQLAVMALYINSRAIPPWSLLLLCASRRMHSIFVLRLFNDCWAMLAAYAGTLALQARRWAPAILLYSLAVSIKMNVLLFAPGVLAVLIKEATVKDVARGVAAGVVLQLTLGAPFLLHYPQSYVVRAFDFSRVFMYKWSVNWQLMPEEWFLSKRLALALLFLNLRLLWSFAEHQWFAAERGVVKAVQKFFQRPATAPAVQPDSVPGGVDNATILHMVFASNFVGILCARSLHYQFYSWYFHTLPFLLLRSTLHPAAAVAVLLGIEVFWNLYPPSAMASVGLLMLHLVVLVASRWGTPSLAAAPAAAPRRALRPASKQR